MYKKNEVSIFKERERESYSSNHACPLVVGFSAADIFICKLCMYSCSENQCMLLDSEIHENQRMQSK